MDHLAEVERLTRRLDKAKAQMDAVMHERNEMIRTARAERHGPGAIGKAADLTPEQVRRICKSTD